MLSIFIYCGKLFHRSVNLQNEIIKCALYTDLKDELTCKKKKKKKHPERIRWSEYFI